MMIKTADFVISSPSVDKCPDGNLPEYAFIGRSNVGKSSLINMLCSRNGLAKTSSTPGKTLLINHFKINNEWYIVDLPGYGFAKHSKQMQRKLEEMISSYVVKRGTLVCLFVLIDIRHKQQTIDREFVDWLGEKGIPFAIVFTKADKLSQSKVQQNAAEWMKCLEDTWEELPPYFITSAQKNVGRDALLGFMERYLK